MRAGAWGRAVGAVVARPSLWPIAVRQVVVLARPGWWRRPPFLPLPDRRYLAFRLETMYGGEGRPPAGADVVGYLRWCKGQRRLAR